MDRGDIFHVRLDPVEGREQAGSRYVMLVSARPFNLMGFALAPDLPFHYQEPAPYPTVLAYAIR